MKIAGRPKLKGGKLQVPLEGNKSLVIPIILLFIFTCLVICACCFGWLVTDVTLHTIGILPTYTLSPTPTFTATPLPTATSTVTPSSTPTSSPTLTPKPTYTPTLPPTDTPGPSPTPIPTYTSKPTQTPHPTFTFTPQPTISQPTATPLPTAPPLPPTPVNPTFSGDTVDPPWWPCEQGQIKGNANTMIYHVPSGRFYAKTYENVQCFNTAAEAETNGYRRSQR